MPQQKLSFLPGIRQLGQLLLQPLRFQCAFLLPGLFLPLSGEASLLVVSQPEDLLPQLFRRVILRQLRFRLALFIRQLFNFRCVLFLLLIGFLKLQADLLFPGSVGLCLFNGRCGFFPGFYFAQVPVDGLKLPVRPGDCLRQRLLPALVLLNQRFQQPRRLLYRQRPRFGLAHLNAQHIIPVHAYPVDILRQAVSCCRALFIQPSRVTLQVFLQRLEELCFKNLAKDCLSFLRRRQKKLEKVSLSNHGNLHKLAAVDAHNVKNCGIHIPLPGQHPPVRIVQLGFRLLCGVSGSSGFRAKIFRVSPHGIGLPGVGKHQLNLCRHALFRVFRPEHVCFPGVAAGLAVQRIGDGVKNRGLARPRVSRDQVKPAAAQLVQIQHCPAGIRAECAHCQFNRSHRSSSRAAAISSLIYSVCSSLMGWLFCIS